MDDPRDDPRLDDPLGISCPACGGRVSLGSSAGKGGAFGRASDTEGDPAGTSQATRDRTRIAFIEDNRLVREGIAALLEPFPDFKVVVADSDDYSPLLAETEPDVVLLNVGVGSKATLEFVRTLRTGFPGPRVLLMDLLPAHEDLVDLIVSGVSGFIHRGASLEDVRGSIQAVAAGLKVMPDEITGTLFSEIAGRSGAGSGTQHEDAVRLTPRETEVIDLVAKGMSNKAIGRRLRISVHTVKSHLRNIMDKLNLHSRLQLVKYALENGDPAPGTGPNPGQEGGIPLAGPANTPPVQRVASRPGPRAPRRRSRTESERGSARSGGRS